MKSNDLKKLSDLLGKQHFRIESHKFESKRISDSGDYQNSVSLSLKKQDQEILFTSFEDDVIVFANTLERTVAIDGEIDFGHFFDLERYGSEWDYLFDENVEKREKIHKKIESGEFKFSYEPEDLILEFLNSRTPYVKKYEVLKRDYFEIRAYYLHLSQRGLKHIETMKKENPKLDQNSRKVDEILRRAFQTNRNFLVNFKKFSKSINLDLNDLIFQINAENDFKRHLKTTLAKNSPLDGETGIKYILELYRRTSEQARPFINALRIAIEIINGEKNPESDLSYVRNCNLIRSMPEYSSLVECLDPYIRHSESHMNTIFDPITKRVKFTSTHGKKREIKSEYSYKQIVDMTMQLENELFLSYPLGFFYHRLALIDTILLSPEYRVLLLSINNRRLPY